MYRNYDRLCSGRIHLGFKSDREGEKGSSEKGSSEKGSREKGSSEKGSREKGSREKGSREKGSREKGSREKGSREKGSRVSEQQSLRYTPAEKYALKVLISEQVTVPRTEAH